jgi:ureidoacrylate peracid hydrolase
VVDAARDAKVPVIYLVVGYRPNQSTAGGEDSPNPRKELALCLMRERPELRGTLLTVGTWDFQIVDALLRGRGIRTLLMAGIASNVCVESTLREAYFHEYWPVMIEDATMPAGSPEIQQATVYNVTTFFGWVSTAGEVAAALHAK